MLVRWQMATLVGNRKIYQIVYLSLKYHLACLLFERIKTITLTMSANEERTVVDTIMEVKSKFAPQNGVATTILVGRDFDTGQVHANELKSTVPGQMYFDENGEILTDIGQPVAEIEQQAETKPDIIDFNKKKVGN